MIELPSAGQAPAAARGDGTSIAQDIGIRVDGLTRAFGSILALDHLSFEVPSGTVFGFLGPERSGQDDNDPAAIGLARLRVALPPPTSSST